MTDVPEHLLRRSQERRAALGGGDAGGPPAAPGEAPGTGAQASAVEPAAGAAPAPVEAPPKPVPPHVAAALRRPRVPRYAIPVLAALPVWALIYAGAMTSPGEELDPQLALGQSVYRASCASCHGAGGEGGTGRPLAEVLLTFPTPDEHIAWVENGSPAAGTPYGAADRPGGQRISQSGGFTQMPGFKDDLSEEEIAAVVRYEREQIGGEEAQPGGATGGAGGETTEEEN